MNSRIYQGLLDYYKHQNNEAHQFPTEDNIRLTKDILISIYLSITCWIRLGKDINNSERLNKQKAQYQPN